jgi:hypothetical protein
MSTRKPVRREGTGGTWTRSPACARAERARRPGGNSWGRRAARGCPVA